MKVTGFIREDYKTNKGESSLYLRVYLNRKYFFISLGVHVDPNNYNKELNKFTKGRNKTKYNNLIKSAIGRAAEIELKYQVNKKVLTRELFEKEFNLSSSLTSFYSFMEEQIKLRRGEIADSTINQQFACLNKMKSFKAECLMTELNEEFVRGFEKYMKKKLNNEQITVHSSMKTMKTYINRAIKLKLMEVSPFQYYKIKKPQTYPEFLSIDERNKLIDLYKSEELTRSKQNVLRWFLFSCFTGLRISDLRAVEHGNVRNGLLSFHPKKTANINNKRVEVPLTKFAKQLIKDENPFRLKGSLFNCISDQKMNKYIKEVMDRLKIEKSVSFHTARHTFATLFLKKCTKANGIIILQELLGHANIETTMIYSHVLDDDIRDAMEEFGS